jgi:hypothetical protein
VTRQPAIHIGILLFVAFQTDSHAPVLERKAVYIFNLTVAFAAGNLFVDMPLVVEQYMFRYIINFNPGCRCLSVEIFMLFLDLRVFFDYIIVAVQAFFHRGDAGKI